MTLQAASKKEMLVVCEACILRPDLPRNESSANALVSDRQRNNNNASLQDLRYLWPLAACLWIVTRYTFMFACLGPRSTGVSASSPSIMSNEIPETRYGMHGGVDHDKSASPDH